MLEQLQSMRMRFLTTPFRENELDKHDYCRLFGLYIRDRLDVSMLTCHPIFLPDRNVYINNLAWIESNRIQQLSIYFVMIFDGNVPVSSVILIGEIEFNAFMNQTKGFKV